MQFAHAASHTLLTKLVVIQEPQIFKLVLGATLGLLVTPLVAWLALAAKGRQYTESTAAQNNRQVQVAKEAETLTTVV